MSKKQSDCLSCAAKAEQYRLEQAKALLKAAGFVEVEGGFYAPGVKPSMAASQDSPGSAITSTHDRQDGIE